MKEKRNYLIYGTDLLISKTEAREAIKRAKKFVKVVEEEILKRRGKKRLI